MNKKNVQISFDSSMSAGEYYSQEVNFLHFLIKLWWANCELHVSSERMDSLFAQLRNSVSSASNIWEYATTLRDSLSKLCDGHLRIGPTLDQVELYYRSGLSFQQVKEGSALLSFEQRYKSSKKCIPVRGDILLEVDNFPVEKYFDTYMLNPTSTQQQHRWAAINSLSYQELLPGETPVPKLLTMLDQGHSEYSLGVYWQKSKGPGPTPNCVIGKKVAERIGLLEIRSFMCRDQFSQPIDFEFCMQLDNALEAINPVCDLILDLRKNGGGRDQQARMVAERISRQPLEWTVYQHQRPYSEVAPKSAMSILEPRHSILDSQMRLWFLIGPACFSTTEILLSAFRNHPDCFFVGERTGGGAGNPQRFILPYSGLSVLIPVTRFFCPGGKRKAIEGQGIAPDYIVIQTLDDLRKGHDTVMDETLKMIQRRSSCN